MITIDQARFELYERLAELGWPKVVDVEARNPHADTVSFWVYIVPDEKTGGLPIIVYANLAKPLADGEAFDAEAYQQAFLAARPALSAAV